MSLPFHLVPSLADATEGAVITVEGDEAHHAVAVRRLRVGESVVLTDGLGTTAQGVVSSTGRRVFEVTVTGVSTAPPCGPAVVAVQALPKGDRGELAVEMLTEIGVSSIVPWAAARCVTAWRDDRAAKSLARWRSTAREAAKQARRSWFPTVVPLASTADVVARVAAAPVAVVLHEEATTPLSAVRLPADGEILVVVGPEGGLSPDEVAAFEDAGAVAVRLGAEVLRTSTAGLAAVSALLARTSRWG